MKKIIAVFAFVALASFGSVNAQATLKLGHIDSQQLLLAMPERAVAEKKVQDFAKTLETQLKTITTEYQSKLTDYEQKRAAMTNTERETVENDLVQLQQRIQDFQVSAQEKIKKQESELLQPMIDKAKKAIMEIGKEGSYTYILDSSVGVTLYEAGDDVLPKVKAKLGLK